MKHPIKYLLASLTVLVSAPTYVHAQSAGSFVATAGAAWLDFPNSHSTELQSQSAFGTFTSPGTNTEVHNIATPVLLLTYFFTDNIAVQGVLGVPPTFRLAGQGQLAPLGPGGPSLPLGNLQPTATIRAWSPIVEVKYYFGHAESKLRPYVGVGVNYTWGSNIHLHPTLEGALNQFAGPGGSVHTSVSPSWNPVLTLGASYNFSKKWYLTGSVSYLPLKTNAEFDAVSRSGSVVLSNKTRITADPIIVFVGVGYRF